MYFTIKINEQIFTRDIILFTEKIADGTFFYYTSIEHVEHCSCVRLLSKRGSFSRGHGETVVIRYYTSGLVRNIAENG